MNKNEKWLAGIFLCIIILNTIYFAHSGYLALTRPVPAHGGRYREGIIGQPRLINPLVGTSGADQSLIRLVYSGLYKYDGEGNIVPDLAESLPQISDDQKQYTIKLRGAQWHNGKPVTAGDVVFTIRMMQNANFGSPLRGLWLNTTVDQTDDRTVIFSNKDISAPFIHNLTLPIMPAAIWANVTAENFLLSSLNLEAIGSGPYTIREIKKMPGGKIQSIKLESFSNYHAGKPYIDILTTVFYDTYEEVVSALHAKSIDGFGYASLDTTLSLNAERNNVNIYKLPIPQYQAAFFNLKNGILSDKLVRTALSRGTDKQEILSTIFADVGLPIAGPILPEQLRKTATEALPDANPREAIFLLEQAGWTLPPGANIRTKKGIPLELTITTNDFPLNAQTAELLATQWKALGINVKLNITETKNLTENLLPNRNYDVLIFAVKSPADPDPFVFWHSSQARHPGLNITQFSSSEADKLISEGRTTIDIATRIEKYKKFQEIITTEVPAIFLSQTVFVYALHTSVKGFNTANLYDPSLRFYNAASWYVEESRRWK